MQTFSQELQHIGYETQIVGLVTVDQPNRTIQDDVSALNKTLLSLLDEQGKDIVLYLHSYAGFPGSAAIAGLSKAERLAAGQKGGILGLIYQSAFIPKQGDTLLKMIGGEYPPWQAPDATTFYADVVEAVADTAVDLLHPQSLQSFNTASEKTYYGIAAYDRRRVYLHTKQDQALPPFAQDAFVDGSGVQWDVQRLDASHSPFLSEPKPLSDIMVEKVEAFAATY
ncbi:MAG: hypothetical protein Q9219_002960 [cf. Caloplaca sp. 3 TL-2023]